MIAPMPTARITHFDLPIKTEPALREYVRRAFGVEIPDTKVCEHHTTPWRAFADAYFARSPVTVWKGSRGFSGKTFLLSLLSTIEGQCLGADVNLLGGSAEQSNRVHDAATRFWSHPSAPRGDISRTLGGSTEWRMGNTMQALVASQRSVRGPHPQRLRLDEVDEIDLEIFHAAMGQTMFDTRRPHTAPQTVIASTWQNINGTMTYVLDQAKQKGWPVYEWCYRECLEPHGWLLKSEVARKRHEVSSRMWDIEYELGKPTVTEDSAFPLYGDANRITCEYDPTLRIAIGIDFGFRTFAATVSQWRNNPWRRYQIGEYQAHGLTTPAALKEFRDEVLPRIIPASIRERGQRRGLLWSQVLAELIDQIGCDPAGDNDQSSTGMADVDDTRRMFPGVRVLFMTDPQHKDPEWRAEQIRRMILDADGQVTWFVDPTKCPLSDAAIENSIYPKHKDGTQEKRKMVKDGKTDHLRDASGYEANVVGAWGRVGASGEKLSWL